MRTATLTVLLLAIPSLAIADERRLTNEDLGAGSADNASKPDRKGLDFFEAKIRPMLVTHCYPCHSAGAARPRLVGTRPARDQ